jgi:NADH dehydrogenase
MTKVLDEAIGQLRDLPDEEQEAAAEALFAFISNDDRHYCRGPGSNRKRKANFAMQRVLIIGAGFAGMYAATSAARLSHLQGQSPKDLEIALISPEPFLVIRPRLYEPKPETMKAPLTELFREIDVRYVQGSVEMIDTASGLASFVGPEGKLETPAYDRLVLATGSTGFRPNVPSLAQHAFGVDLMDEAIKLDHHLHALAKQPPSKARNTVVVAGAGFTGIETATEMPRRLRTILGNDADIRVVLVERGELIAPQTGDNPRPVIAKAIRDAGVETILGMGVTALDESGVTLSNGQHIESATVIWTAGMRASSLPSTLDAEISSWAASSDRGFRRPDDPACTS